MENIFLEVLAKLSAQLFKIIFSLGEQHVITQLTLAGVVKAPAPFFLSFSYTSILGFPFVEPADFPSSLRSRT
jgi:hypothetical protein